MCGGAGGGICCWAEIDQEVQVEQEEERSGSLFLYFPGPFGLRTAAKRASIELVEWIG